MTPEEAKKTYQPKYPVCESMCATCPFQPSGMGYARDHEDFPAILQTIELGVTFFCHKTVIEDHRTEMAWNFKTGEPEPDPPVQDHFRACLGAVTYKRGELTLKGDTKPAPKQRRGKKVAKNANDEAEGPWDVKNVKEQLPNCKVRDKGQVQEGCVRGRKNQHATVCWGVNKEYEVEVAWETLVHCLNNDVPVTVA